MAHPASQMWLRMDYEQMLRNQSEPRPQTLKWIMGEVPHLGVSANHHPHTHHCVMGGSPDYAFVYTMASTTTLEQKLSGQRR